MAGNSVEQSILSMSDADFLNAPMPTFESASSHEQTETQTEKKEEVETEQILEGKTFVDTGSLNHFDNRKQLKEEIEQMGGKVTGSVSKKTDYLINNDKMSQSSKNKKAMELDIPILSEEDFLELIGR